MKPLTGGPDAYRYLTLAQGKPVPRPFHLRWLLPYFCEVSPKAWWAVFVASWPVAAGGFVWWRLEAGDDWRVAVAASALFLALPGVLGPKAVAPVGVDMPAAAVSLIGLALITDGQPARVAAGVLVVAIAACIRETSPVWVALWAWSLWPLIALCVVVCRALCVKPGKDPLGARFDEIAAHPVKAALAAHRGRWRDARLMVVPWGVCLAALTGLTWQMAVVLVLAYGQLLIATDSVRLYQHAAGPVLAVAAAQVIPVAWLPLAVVVHVVWWVAPERV